MPKSLILDPSKYDLNHVVADINEIRRYNHQRFEMEQLSAIVYEDPVECCSVGYKDLTQDEFWVRGHMPGMPVMPGVVMLEAAAQLASFSALRFKLLKTEVVGFGGLKEVKFRGVVRPGDRFVIMLKLLKARSQMVVCEFQCLVRENVVCEGVLMGVPLPTDSLKSQPSG